MTDAVATAEAGATPAIAGDDAPKGRDYEAEARKDGWRPKDEFKGDPEDWKTARQFVEYGELKSGFEARFAKLEKMGERREAALKRQHQREMDALKEERTAAIKKGDVNAVEEIDGKMKALNDDDAEPEKAIAKDASAPAGSKEANQEAYADWAAENPWWNADTKMTGYAQAQSELYVKDHPGCTMKETLVHVDKKMRAKFPDYEWDTQPEKTERKPAANAHAAVDGGGAFGGSRRSSPLDALPNEARAQAKKDMAAYPDTYPTAEAWVKAYNS